MIKQNTLLILGAGASFDYGFPLGSELYWQILNKFQSQGTYFQVLETNGFSKSKILEFRNTLEKSGQKSVDAFLEYRTKFIEIGKIAIAMMLLPKEKEEVLFSKETTRNWYQLLYEQLLTPSFEDFGNNNLSVITFNYDRSLEQYLLTALQNTYGKNLKECAKQLKSIPIIHVHGKLGDLPELGDNVIKYDSRNSYTGVFVSVRQEERDEHSTNLYHTALQSSQSIKIIHEDIGKDKEFKKAHQLIEEAKEIHFLGFGYHPTNLQRLVINEMTSSIFGTGYKFTVKQFNIINQFGFSRLSNFLSGDRDRVREMDIYEYLNFYRTFT